MIKILNDGNIKTNISESKYDGHYMSLLLPGYNDTDFEIVQDGREFVIKTTEPVKTQRENQDHFGIIKNRHRTDFEMYEDQEFSFIIEHGYFLRQTRYRNGILTLDFGKSPNKVSHYINEEN